MHIFKYQSMYGKYGSLTNKKILGLFAHLIQACASFLQFKMILNIYINVKRKTTN